MLSDAAEVLRSVRRGYHLVTYNTRHINPDDADRYEWMCTAFGDECRNGSFPEMLDKHEKVLRKILFTEDAATGCVSEPELEETRQFFRKIHDGLRKDIEPRMKGKYNYPARPLERDLI